MMASTTRSGTRPSDAVAILDLIDGNEHHREHVSVIG